MKRILNALVTVLIILTGTVAFKANYSPEVEAHLDVYVPGESTDKAILDLSSDEQARLLELVNEGSHKDLVAIHGIAEARSIAIQNARPFSTPNQILAVNGVGKRTFREIIAYADRGSF